MNPTVLNAALAGLLHDVGKLEQRASADPRKPAPGLEKENQRVHATWTSYFIQTYVPKRYQGAALAGGYHHMSEKSPATDPHLSVLVELADKLSAGERADKEEDEENPPRQQVTIFDRVDLHGKGKQNGWHYLPLKSLKLDWGTLFPTGELSKDQAASSYLQLCEILRKIARQDYANPETYIENLLDGLKQTAWCVPSAYYYSVPDVSLYDHSRMTAALAVCMAEWSHEEVQDLLQAVRESFYKEKLAQDPRLEKEVALLVGGDISGLQDFIYTISSKGAAQTLRGRSFYLQLLAEAVMSYVLRELGLPITNVIYSGGGHFFLLAPVRAEGTLKDIRRKVTLKLLEHHGTSLYLAMGWDKVPASGFRVGVFREHWDRMHKAVNEAKRRRYTELGDELYPLIFEPPSEGGNPESTCSVCGEDHRKVSKWDIEREEQNRICTLCKSFIDEIGKKLPESSFLALGFSQPIEGEKSTASDALKAFGMEYQFLKSAQDSVNLPGAEQISLWALDDPKDEKWPQCSSVPCAHTLRYTVNRVPRDTFDELQKKVKGGFERLGVLRMDVDNLGDIFKYGLGKLATLSRISTLSFQMSLYFEGWVKHLAESREYEGLIYSVYSGGDDLFLIGPWDRMPELAMQIREDFAQYTARHPRLCISGGMAFIDGKYPVYQAADDAQKALDQAKDLPGKNAFSFLGTAWTWEVFQRVKEKQERLQRLVGSGEESLEGPQAILGILRELAADEAEETKRRKSRPVWGRWMWMGAYRLKRMAERYVKTKPVLADEIDQIRKELAQDDYKEINEWGAAARWTHLIIRKKGNK